MSGPGKEDKPGKDYWKTGDPNLRAKVISSVGVAIIVLTIAVGATSFQYYDAPEQSNPSQGPETDDSQQRLPAPPQPQPTPTPEQEPEPYLPTQGPDDEAEPDGGAGAPPPTILEILAILVLLLFIVGIILVIIGIVSYLRKRKKAIT